MNLASKVLCGCGIVVFNKKGEIICVHAGFGTVKVREKMIEIALGK